MTPWKRSMEALSDRCPTKLSEKVIDAMVNAKG
jgi:hypothetical protein